MEKFLHRPFVDYKNKIAFLARKCENFWYYDIALKKMGFEQGLLMETVCIRLTHGFREYNVLISTKAQPRE